MLEPARSGEKVIRGIPVSPGVCRGKILVLGKSQEDKIPKHHLPQERLAHEAQRLEQALIDTRRQILEVQRQVNRGLGAEDATIFDAHLLVLEDPTLIEEVSRIIFQEKVSAEYAFQQVADKYAKTLSAIDDEYLRERAADMRDVTARILNNLLGRPDEFDPKKIEEPCIIISNDLTPPRPAQLDKKRGLGFAPEIA